jgi:hypothetical protein
MNERLVLRAASQHLEVAVNGSNGPEMACASETHRTSELETVQTSAQVSTH